MRDFTRDIRTPRFPDVGSPTFGLLDFLILGVRLSDSYRFPDIGSSGVTRAKGQPGQLTNKQLSWRSAERSWVGGEPLTETHLRSLLYLHFELVHFEAYDFRNTVIN